MAQGIVGVFDKAHHTLGDYGCPDSTTERNSPNQHYGDTSTAFEWKNNWYCLDNQTPNEVLLVMTSAWAWFANELRTLCKRLVFHFRNCFQFWDFSPHFHVVSKWWIGLQPPFIYNHGTNNFTEFSWAILSIASLHWYETRNRLWIH